MSQRRLILPSLIVLTELVGLTFNLYPNKWHQLTYYTLLSNILVLAFFAWLVLGRPTPSASLTRIKGAVTTAILLTFFVYLVLLMPTATPEQFWRVQNFALHFIAPILVILDWLLYDAKGHYRWFEPLTWTVLPLIYMTFALIRGAVFHLPIPNEKASPYPYFFLNIDRIGWWGFSKYFVAILAVFLLLAYGMLALKRAPKLGRFHEKH